MPDLDKVFSPENIERKWYASWLKNKCFAKKIDEAKESFCVLMPPPNVTGVLHMGHLLNNTIQDVLVRLARHTGHSSLWLPGTDHAGISMQVKVEKELAKTGIKRKEIGREKFLEHACEWRDKHGDMILNQLKNLCVSCDWDNKTHTLDTDYSLAVTTSFVELYKRGYIYRGKKMVNWCPVSLTALSDEEVIMTPRKAKMYKVRYEIVEKPGQFLEICTTRPETIMVDEAIAVNPDDKRFQSLVGLHCWRPLNKKAIPIISDNIVDKEFGTGALKITPAHDVVDFEVGIRHNLPMTDALNPNGTMSKVAGKEFEGLDRFIARDKAAEVLKNLGALVSVEDYENNIGISERGGVPIEPRISEQWFMKYPKVEEAKRAVTSGMIKFYPARWEKTYLHWLENIKDWCISRQLWWGHRIPVWYKKGADRSDLTQAHISVEPPADIENWEQDEDVLDTWYSSWLWPFGTFGWPNTDKMKEEGFQYFFPTNTLVTGPDIIFFWVARMIMASLELVGDEKKTLTDAEIAQRIPFKNVYFTGIIRDEIGRKMSKSLGNSPEPLEMLKKYGVDGLRVGLLMIAPNGHDVIFSEERMSQGRNFCNKLWNAFRFRIMQGDFQKSSSLSDIVSRINNAELDVDDHAILAKLIKLRENFADCFDKFEINSAIQSIYNFFWSDYCDWYVEVSKPRLRNGNATVLAVHDIIWREILLMLNSFMPCVTEELWHVGMFCNDDEFIQDSQLESADDMRKIFAAINIDYASVKLVDQLTDFVNKGRALKAQFGKSTSKVKFFVKSSVGENLFTENHEKLLHLLGAESLDCTIDSIDLPAMVTEIGTLYVDIKDDVNSEEEKTKLQQKIAEIEKLIVINENKLSSESFVKNAPQNVVDGAKKLLEDNKAKKLELEKLLANFS